MLSAEMALAHVYLNTREIRTSDAGQNALSARIALETKLACATSAQIPVQARAVRMRVAM